MEKNQIKSKNNERYFEDWAKELDKATNPTYFKTKVQKDEKIKEAVNQIG